jgi:hypothetical protein
LPFQTLGFEESEKGHPHTIVYASGTTRTNLLIYVWRKRRGESSKNIPKYDNKEEERITDCGMRVNRTMSSGTD